MAPLDDEWARVLCAGSCLCCSRASGLWEDFSRLMHVQTSDWAAVTCGHSQHLLRPAAAAAAAAQLLLVSAS